MGNGLGKLIDGKDVKFSKKFKSKKCGFRFKNMKNT